MRRAHGSPGASFFTQFLSIKFRISIRATYLLLLFPFKSLTGCRASFLRTQTCKQQNSLLIFLFLISTTNFEKTTSYFSTSNPAFSQAYVLRVRASFSPAETSFTALSFRSFRNNFLFSFVPSQKVTG